MPIRVDVGGRIVEFPDGTPESDMLAALDTLDQPQAPMSGRERADAMMKEDSPYGQMARGVAGGGVMSIGPQAAEGTRKVISGLARRMYQGALKPTKAVTDRTPGGARALADTGLREGLTVGASGVRKATDLISDLDSQVTAAISGSSATVPRQAVLSRIADPVRQFKDQVAPLSDLRSIANVGKEFRATNPAQIPVEQAQLMKQGTYRAQAKKFGQQAGANVEAEKALARGLKEEIASAVPAVAPLNARQGSLIQIRKALEDATRRTGNRDTFGLTDVIAAGTQPGLLAATLAMRAQPQSLLARGVHGAGQKVNPDALQAAIRSLLMSTGQGQ